MSDQSEPKRQRVEEHGDDDLSPTVPFEVQMPKDSGNNSDLDIEGDIANAMAVNDVVVNDRQPPEDGRVESMDPMDWETEEFSSLAIQGVDLMLRPDVGTVPMSLVTLTQNLVDKFDTMIQTWDEPVHMAKSPMMVVAVLLDANTNWHCTNELLISKLLATLCHGTLRAHPDSVYQYMSGAWVPVTQIHEMFLRHMEEALLRSQTLFVTLWKGKVARDWDLSPMVRRGGS